MLELKNFKSLLLLDKRDAKTAAQTLRTQREEEDKEEDKTGVKSRSYFCLSAFLVGFSFISLTYRSDLPARRVRILISSLC